MTPHPLFITMITYTKTQYTNWYYLDKAQNDFEKTYTDPKAQINRAVSWHWGEPRVREKSQGMNGRSVLTASDPHYVQRSRSHLEANCITGGQCYWICTLAVVVLSSMQSNRGQSQVVLLLTYIYLVFPLLWHKLCTETDRSMIIDRIIHFTRIFQFDATIPVYYTIFIWQL